MHTPTSPHDRPPSVARDRAIAAPIAVIAFLLTASPAWANAGTPLMWFTAAHLLIGNLVIGAVEGLILAKWLRVRPVAAVIVMILANYASCWAGFPIAATISEKVPTLIGSLPLQGLIWILLARFALFLIITILIEWPFVWFLIRKSPRALSRSFRPCVGVQLISYAALVPLYLLTGTASLATRAQFTPTPDFASPANAWVYFIDPDNAQIFRIRLDGTQRERAAEARFSNPMARLFVDRNERGLLDLFCVPGEDKQPAVVVSRDFAKTARPLRNTSMTTEPDTWSNRQFFDFDTATPTDQWYVRCGFWPGTGISVDKGQQQEYSLGFELPFSAREWLFRNAVMYSKQQGLFQLDDDIIVIDAPTRRLARLTRGRGPVVVLDPLDGDVSPQTRPAESKQN